MTPYEVLMDQWDELTAHYPGWGLSEVQNLTPRERVNWQRLARARRRAIGG